MATKTYYAAIVGFWLGYILLIAILPTWFPPDSELLNVAARSGYNIGIVYYLIAVWSVIGLSFFTWFSGSTPTDQETTHSPLPKTLINKSGYGLECLVVGALSLMLYWPAFLARYGNYIEDNYFMNVLARMQCGQLPYRDFEFLYGPLMIYPAYYWIELLGFSMHSYYLLIAIMQAVGLIILLRLFQAHIPAFKNRLIMVVIFAPFVFDSLLGLNYSAWRILPALLAMLMVSASPDTLRKAFYAGILAGLQLGYSYEFGIITLIALSMLYVACFINQRKTVFISAALVMFFSAVAVAGLSALALTGDSFSDFFSATAQTLQYAQQQGLGSFYFYWTINTLALFALLSLAIVSAGSGLGSIVKTPMQYGDRYFLVALLFALGTLRVGIQRADVWHITLPFIPLILAFLWSSEKKLFKLQSIPSAFILCIICIASLTRLFGLLPTASYFGGGLFKGAKSVLLNKKPEINIVSRRYSLQNELAQPDADIIKLAEYFAQPEHSQRPIVFYANRWWLGTHTGVCPSGYAFYQLMYSDAYQPISAFLDSNVDSLVVISEQDYLDLYENQAQDSPTPPLSLVKQWGTWLSSIHYRQKKPEVSIKRDIWRRNVGVYLLRHYHRIAQFGDNIVLQRQPDNV